MRFLSRKFLLAVVAAGYSIAAAAELKIPLDQILVADAIVAVYIVVQGIIDAIKAKQGNY